MFSQCIYDIVREQTIHSITAALSDPRFETYRKVAKSKEQALRLYLWNIEAAGAVAATTGMVEVQLRNSINARLQNWNRSEPLKEPGRARPYSTGWLKDPAPRLRQIISPPNKRPLWRKAEPALRDENGLALKSDPSHDDLVAALPFGSWLFLLPQPSVTSDDNPRMRIWNEALRFAFSARPGSRYETASHAVVYRWANTVRYARNRASHLEPLLNEQELLRFHRVSHRLMNAMNPAAASWLAGQQYIPLTIRKRPS